MGSIFLLEQQGKELFRRVGIRTPRSRLATSKDACVTGALELSGPAMIKAQVRTGARGKKGGVRRVSTAHEAQTAWHDIQTLFGPCDVLVEELVPHEGEHYLALDARGAEVVLIATEQGGIEVEDATHVLRVPVRDPSSGPSPSERAQIAAHFPHHEAGIDHLLSQVWTVAHQYDAVLVEINPLVIDGVGPIALDAKVVLDGYAAARHIDGPQAWPGDTIDAASTPGVDLIPLTGSVGIVGLGAGLSLYMADRLDHLGPGCSYIFDFTRAAVDEWAAIFDRRPSDRLADVVAEGLRQRPTDTKAILVNLTSGGTPTDGLLLSVLAALPRATCPVVFHVAGNSMARARTLLEEREIPYALSIEEALTRAAGFAT